MLDVDELVFSPPELGCVLYLPGPSGGGSKIHDRSPYGNAGTITGATWKRLPSGLWVLSFDGTDDYVTCGTSPNLLIMGDSARTGEAWIKLNTLGGAGGRNVLSYGVGATSNMVQFGIDSAGYLALYLYANDHVSSTIVSLGDWHHIVFTLVETTTKLYLDGNLVSTKTDHTTINTLADSVTFKVGCRYDTNWKFDGLIALLSFHWGALSALEIQNHFQREKHLFGVW